MVHCSPQHTCCSLHSITVVEQAHNVTCTINYSSCNIAGKLQWSHTSHEFLLPPWRSDPTWNRPWAAKINKLTLASPSQLEWTCIYAFQFQQTTTNNMLGTLKPARWQGCSTDTLHPYRPCWPHTQVVPQCIPNSPCWPPPWYHLPCQAIKENQKKLKSRQRKQRSKLIQKKQAPSNLYSMMRD